SLAELTVESSPCDRAGVAANSAAHKASATTAIINPIFFNIVTPAIPENLLSGIFYHPRRSLTRHPVRPCALFHIGCGTVETQAPAAASRCRARRAVSNK